MADLDKKAIREKFLELTEEQVKAGHVCNYTNLTAKGVKNGCYRAGDICHARLHQDGAAILYSVKGKQENDPHLIEWLARESPLACTVMNKDEDPKEFVRRGLLIDLNKAGAWGLWIAKVHRYWQEDSWRIDLWNKLFPLVDDKLMALVGCSIVDKQGKPANATHNSVFGYGSKEQLAAHLKLLQDLKKPPPGRWGDAGVSYYGGCMDVWALPKAKRIKVPDGWGGYTMKDAPASLDDYVSGLNDISKMLKK